MSRVFSLVTLAAALAILALGIWKCTCSAGDGDAFGYVSQSAMLAKGELRIEQQFQRSMPWPYAEWSFAPAGYRPAADDRGFIVPTYPPGLPLVMAAFRRVAGAGAVFFVVPLMGALCVLMTGALGRRVHSPLAGVIAALVLASSPSFLFQLMQPLSDVPAAAWWTIALTLALHDSAGASLASGAAASMAILTRPNLVPLAGAIGVFLLWQAVRADPCARAAAVRRVVLFAAGAVPGGVAIGALQNYLYGSPLRSGYEEFSALFAWANAAPNLKQYPRWLIATQTPIVCLALAAPWFPRIRRGGLPLAWVAVVFFCYLFYVPFGADDWSYLRFLLPAYPALIVLSVASALELIDRVTARERVRLAASIAVFASLLAWQGREALHRGVFSQHEVEQRYEDVGRYVTDFTPSNAVFITGLHAGSIRYYAGRLTIRFDWVGERRLDQVVEVMREKGYHPYIALEEGEEAGFRERFVKMSDLARLDWPPAAQRSQPIRVRIYDPLDRARAAQGASIRTAEIAVRRRR